MSLKETLRSFLLTLNGRRFRHQFLRGRVRPLNFVVTHYTQLRRLAKQTKAEHSLGRLLNSLSLRSDFFIK